MTSVLPEGLGGGRSGRQWIVVLAALVVVCAGIRAAEPILSPTVLGAYVATVDMPLVGWLRRRGVPLVACVAFVLLTDAVVLSGFSALVVAASSNLSARLPHYYELLDQAVLDWGESLGNLDVSARLEDVLNPRQALGIVASAAGNVASGVWDVVVALIIAAFLLLRFGRGDHTGVAPLLRMHEARRTLGEVNRYIAVKTATSMSTGFLVGTMIWALGGELPVAFGVLAFSLNYIPSLGSFVAAVPAIGIGLLVHGAQHALVLTMGYSAINLVIGNIVEPRVMGRALGLWPVVVLLSVMFWGLLLGVIGALLSALLTALVKMLLLATDDLRPLGLMLGPRRPQRPVPEGSRATSDLLEETLPQTREGG